MSRIKDLKNRTKLSLDEMFVDSQTKNPLPAGNLDNQLDGNTKEQEPTQQSKRSVVQNSDEGVSEIQVQGLSQRPNKVVRPKRLVENLVLTMEKETQEDHSEKKPLYPPHTSKMTFNLTETFYKAFNDI